MVVVVVVDCVVSGSGVVDVVTGCCGVVVVDGVVTGPTVVVVVVVGTP